MNSSPAKWTLSRLVVLSGCLLTFALSLEGQTPVSPDIALAQAIGRKDAGAMKLALDSGANPNSTGDIPPGERGRYTPLARAIEAGDINCLKLLLEAGAEVRLIPGEKPWTHPLALAQAFDRDPALFDLVSRYCKDLPDADVVMDQLLRPALRKNRTSHIEWLRSKGADFAHVSAQGICSPLAALEGAHISLANELLVQNELRLVQSSRKTLDPHEVMEAAAARPHLESEIAAVLLKLRGLGFVFQERDRWGTLFTERAVGYRQPAIAHALGLTDKSKLAAIKPYTSEEIIRRVAGYGTNEEFAEIFERFSRGATAKVRRQMATSALISLLELREWSYARWSARLDQLLTLGADINGSAVGRSTAEVSPLQAAVSSSPELIDQLLARGAKLNRVNPANGCTVLQWAVISQSRNLPYLLEKGAKVTDFEKSPLLVSVIRAERRDPQLLETLLAAGADPYSKPGGSKSAVETAAEMRDIALLRMLDSRHQQKALLAEFTPPPGSPFIGVWSNEQGEFATVSLILNEEGLGILGMAVMSAGWLPWKITDPKNAQMELKEGKRSVLIHMTLNDEGTLSLRVNDKPPAVLKRQSQKPPTMRELSKQLQQH
jgi:ankyrin repeat protein